LIAHSMGNRVMTATLNRLATKQSFSQHLQIIQQIVLAAPDIDQNVFKETILPQFQRVGSRRTLYASDKDEALHLSESLRGGLPRLGEAGLSLFVENGLDTIDASNVSSTGNNHSYIFDTKELISDLHFLLNLGLSPLDRRLRARIKNTFKYWLFPK
jgi:esterase/lipase superfamily enzyme